MLKIKNEKRFFQTFSQDTQVKKKKLHLCIIKWMLRNPSFVSIRIENEVKMNDIRISFWESVRFFFYYVFSFVYVFLRKYQISECYFDKKVRAPVSNVKILDHGIFLDYYNLLIPYEYILYIVTFKTHNTLSCFAYLDGDELKLGDSLLNIKVFNSNPKQFNIDIRNNMYYHLKYNKKKIDTGVLHFSTLKKILDETNSYWRKKVVLTYYWLFVYCKYKFYLF